MERDQITRNIGVDSCPNQTAFEQSEDLEINAGAISLEGFSTSRWLKQPQEKKVLRKCFHWLGLTTCHLLSEHSFLNEKGESERSGGKKEEAGEIRGNSWRREVKLRRWNLRKEFWSSLRPSRELSATTQATKGEVLQVVFVDSSSHYPVLGHLRAVRNRCPKEECWCLWLTGSLMCYLLLLLIQTAELLPQGLQAVSNGESALKGTRPTFSSPFIL
ncbi:uncharacterized protein LOC144335563 [Macaca mulatta]